jgi:hypothetical protein
MTNVRVHECEGLPYKSMVSPLTICWPFILSGRGRWVQTSEHRAHTDRGAFWKPASVRSVLPGWFVLLRKCRNINIWKTVPFHHVTVKWHMELFKLGPAIFQGILTSYTSCIITEKKIQSSVWVHQEIVTLKYVHIVTIVSVSLCHKQLGNIQDKEEELVNFCVQACKWVYRHFNFYGYICLCESTPQRSWLRHYAISQKVVGSSPDEVDSFNWPNPSSWTMALGSTQPLMEMSTRNLPGG